MKKHSAVLAAITRQIRIEKRVQLFLDYDGTLVPIARTPDQAQPDIALLELLSQLAGVSQIQTTILSGRPLFSLQAMLPIPGLILAGIYGAEIQTPDNAVLTRIETTPIRPTIEKIKSIWMHLVAGKNGFLVEDKGLAVALHARFATQQDADAVLARAQEQVSEIVNAKHFRQLGGHRFLEIAPACANKGQTVDWMIEHFKFDDALLVYFGDDDKDEEAFQAIRRRGGYPIGVGARRGDTHALERLASPSEVRDWLRVIRGSGDAKT